MASGGVTQIDTNYLNKLKAELETQKQEVEAQLNGIDTNYKEHNYGPKVSLGHVPPLDDHTLNLQAGASTFDAGKQIQNAYYTMGGSVHDRLTWLDNTLTAMIYEINNTIHKLHGTESLNNEQVDELVTEFQNTINNMGGSPGGGLGGNLPNPNTSGQ